MRYARYLDTGFLLDNETESIDWDDDFVTEPRLTVLDSITEEFEYETKSSLEAIHSARLQIVKSPAPRPGVPFSSIIS